MLIFAAAMGASYIAAMMRPISQAEVNTADLGLISLVGWIGIVLVANDGIPSIHRLHALLRRIAAAAAALAVLGIAQFATGQPLTDLIDIPGLSVNTAFSGVAAREGFTRPAGTAVHPIEFGVVLSAALPIALACAMTMTTRAWWRRWFPVTAIAIAIPLSISRSAIVGTIVCLAVLAPSWSKSARRVMYACVGVLVVAFFMTIPGFLGTLSGLFTGIGSDASAQSRTGSYAIAWEFIQQTPVVGRAFSTFLPAYWILDNQYLGLIIEAGLVGLLDVGVFSWAQDPRRASRAVVAGDARHRQLGHALAVSVASAAVGCALYDLLAFPMSAGVLFLALGLCGAFWRLQRRSTPQASSP